MSITKERLETIAADLKQLIAESHNPPKSAEDVIAGLDAVKNLYLTNLPTTRNAELTIALVEVLFANYPAFGDCYFAVAQALDQQ